MDMESVEMSIAEMDRIEERLVNGYPSEAEIGELVQELKATADAAIEARFARSDTAFDKHAVRALWLAAADWSGRLVPKIAYETNYDRLHDLCGAARGDSPEEYRKRLTDTIHVIQQGIQENRTRSHSTMADRLLADIVGELPVNLDRHYAPMIYTIAKREPFWTVWMSRTDVAERLAFTSLVLSQSTDTVNEKALALATHFEGSALHRAVRHLRGRDHLSVREYVNAAYGILAQAAEGLDVDEDGGCRPVDTRYPMDVASAASSYVLDAEAIAALTPVQVIEDTITEAFPAIGDPEPYAQRLHGASMTIAEAKTWLNENREVLAQFTDDDGAPLEELWLSLLPASEDQE
jgi:hypothetical protein